MLTPKRRPNAPNLPYRRAVIMRLANRGPFFELASGSYYDIGAQELVEEGKLKVVASTGLNTTRYEKVQ